MKTMVVGAVGTFVTIAAAMMAPLPVGLVVAVGMAATATLAGATRAREIQDPWRRAAFRCCAVLVLAGLAGTVSSRIGAGHAAMDAPPAGPPASPSPSLPR